MNTSATVTTPGSMRRTRIERVIARIANGGISHDDVYRTIHLYYKRAGLGVPKEKRTTAHTITYDLDTMPDDLLATLANEADAAEDNV